MTDSDRQRLTRPYRPRTNGKAERFIQTALREWAYAFTYQDSTERAAQLPDQALVLLLEFGCPGTTSGISACS